MRYGQQLPAWPRQAPLVFDGVRPKIVVAARDLADPVGGIPGDMGYGFGSEATR